MGRGLDDPPVVPALHLAIRFLLEIAIFASYAVWGWQTGGGGLGGGALAFVAVIVPAGLWGVFRTPGDTSGGRAIVPIPGPARLALEMAVIGLGAAGLWTAWSRAAAETLLTVLALHYSLTWERHWWLLRGTPDRRQEA